MGIEARSTALEVDALPLDQRGRNYRVPPTAFFTLYGSGKPVHHKSGRLYKKTVKPKKKKWQ